MGFLTSGYVDTQHTNAVFSLINDQYGVYVAQVMSLSQHLPGGTAESEAVAVSGADSIITVEPQRTGGRRRVTGVTCSTPRLTQNYYGAVPINK